MVKTINNTTGKSDRQQEHYRERGRQWSQTQLEVWYKKITTPKPRNYEVYGRPVRQPKQRVRRIGRDPVKLETKRLRDLERAKAYYALNPHKWEMKCMAKEDKNII